MKGRRTFTVLIERDEEGYFVAMVPALAGCHTQAKTLDALVKRAKEATNICLEIDPTQADPLEFVGIQQISV